jgi:signal transduction histidine kinase
MVCKSARSRRGLSTEAVVVVSLLAAWSCICASPARAADLAPPGVLILHSNQRPTPAAVIIEDTLRATVPAASKRPVAMYSEYLDVELPESAAAVDEHLRFLARKYVSRNLRVIVASAAAAIPFALGLREQMQLAIPVVHVAMPVDVLGSSPLPPDVIGRPVDLDAVPTLKLAMHLHPAVKRVVVVLGATERDRGWERRIRASAARLADGPAMEYWMGPPTPELLPRLAALPPDTIVLTPGYFTDRAGETVTPRRSVERITAASAVPVYGMLDSFLDSGIVGGSMTPFAEQAREAGLIVARLLAGTPAGSIDASPIAQVSIVDWRQLRRWRIDERSLPAGTIVRFREPSVWDRYRSEISIGIAIVLLQTGMIAVLLVQGRSRRRMAAALEESQQRMQLAARAARLSTWIWDIAGDKVRAGMRPRPPAGEQPIAFQGVLESAHPADRGDLERALNKAVATGEEIDVEYRTVAGDGEVRWIAARGRAERASGQQVIGVAIDITERKRAELRAVEDRSALRRMTRVSMLGQLSASIAHQLNQPLAAILGNAEAAQKMLARERVDLAELREICNDIVAEDNRAAQVIRRLSALYKRDEMHMAPLDLNTLIRETLDLLRAELLIRNVTPIADLAPSLPLVDGETVQLQQVVLNLVLNAADAMRGTQVEDRRLVIRTEASDAELRMLVIDHGPGIAVEHLASVFDAFWTTKPEGMGIGLAICRSIVTAHQGHIAAANNVNGGTTFCVSLPFRNRT